MNFWMSKIVFALGATYMLAAPVVAQEADDNAQVEQGWFGDTLKGAFCKAVVPAVGAMTGGLPGAISPTTFGLCKPENPAQPDKGAPNPPSSVSGRPAPTGAMRPALSVNLLKVTQSGGKVDVGIAAQDTVFEKGTGFSVIVTSNAPGYLEVWSIDDKGATFIEGAVLPAAGTLTLPKKVQGYYRFDDKSAEDFIQFRYYPCELAEQEGFVPAENQAAAELTARAATAANQLAVELNTCTFSAAGVDTKKPQYALFNAAFPVDATYGAPTASHLAVANGTRPMTTIIALKRK